MVPSAPPTVTYESATEAYLEMILEGVNRTWNNRDFENWARLTSSHVTDFWNTYQWSPLEVGRTLTILVSSSRLPRSSGRRLQQPTQAGTSAPLPLQIIYNQTVRFVEKLPVGSSNSSALSVENAKAQLFLTPFQVDALSYVTALANLTNNSGPIFIKDVFVGEPPTRAPTPSPDSEGRNDRNIIIITVVITSLSLCVAGGYIVYLTRKEDQDPLLQPMPSEDYDENEFYRASGLSPPPATINTVGDTVLLQEATTPEPTHRRGRSEGHGLGRMGTLHTMDTEVSSYSAVGRERDDIASSYPAVHTLPLSVISGEEGLAGDRFNTLSSDASPRQQQFTGYPQQVQFGDQDDVEDQNETEEEDGGSDRIDEGPSPLLMTGFQMEIEDLDDEYELS